MKQYVRAMKHTCGKYFPYPEGVPTYFLGILYAGKICKFCGEDFGPDSLTWVVGYFQSTVKWWNPLTWFSSRFVETWGRDCR